MSPNSEVQGELIRLRNRIAALEENGAELLRRAEKAEGELEKADATELKRTKALLKMAERHAMNCDANQAAAEAKLARAEARHAGLNAHHLRTVADHQAELDALVAARCPSCDHLAGHHQPDGCWYTTTTGAAGRDLVCPCALAAPESPTATPAAAPVRSHLFGGGR